MSAGGCPTANVRVWSESQPSWPPTRSAITRVAAREHVPVRPLAEGRVRARAAERRVGVAGHGAARPAQDLAVVHLLVEAAEAQLALVACPAHDPLDLELDVGLAHPDADQRRHRLGAAAAPARRRPASARDPTPTYRAHGAHGGGAVAELDARQAAPVAEVGRAGSTSSSNPTRAPAPTPAVRELGPEAARATAAARSARAADSRRARSSTRRTSSTRLAARPARPGAPAGSCPRSRPGRRAARSRPRRGRPRASAARRRPIRRSISAAGVTCPIVTGA